MALRSYILAALIAAVIIVAILVSYTYFLSPRSSKDYILIGTALSLTGPVAPSGNDILNAYQACVEYINSKGGIYIKELGRSLPIKLIYYDDSSDPNKARSLYEQLITQDKVDLLWPPFGTPSSMAVIPVINKYKIPTLFATAALPHESVIKNTSPYMYITWQGHIHVGASYAALIKKLISDHPELRRIAILYAETDPTVGWGTGLERALREWGVGEVVFTASFPVTSTDLRGILLRMADAKPDIVATFTFGADTFVLVSQMRELRINPKVFLMSYAASTTDFYKRFDNATREGIIFWNTWDPMLSPEFKALWDIYTSKFGYSPLPSHVGQHFKFCLVFKAVMDKVQSLDPEKIKRFLDSGETFDVPFGPFSPIKFVDQAMDPNFIIFAQYQDGVPKPIFMTTGRYPNIKFVDAPFLVPYKYPKPEWK